MQESNQVAPETAPTPEEVQAVVDAALPPAPKELSLTEYKKLMKLYFTVKRDVVESCGHKFNPNEQPRQRNCEHCWLMFFQMNGENTKLADEIFREKGEHALIQIQGKKYVSMFKKFMSTIAEFIKEHANVPEVENDYTVEGLKVLEQMEPAVVREET